MKLETLLEEASDLNQRIKAILTESGFYKTYGLDTVDFDADNMDHLYAIDEI